MYAVMLEELNDRFPDFYTADENDPYDYQSKLLYYLLFIRIIYLNMYTFKKV